MADEQRYGYITFEGLGGPRRLFYFDEPLALGVLVILERAATRGRAAGIAGELDPTVHKPHALEQLAARARAEAVDRDRERPCCYGLGELHHDRQTGALWFTPCATCGAHYAGDRAPHKHNGRHIGDANISDECPDCKGAGILYADPVGRGDFVPEPCARCAPRAG